MKLWSAMSAGAVARSAAFFVIALALSGSLAIVPASARKLVEGVGTFELENGMQAVVIPDHRAPVVTHMVWYRVGSADELPGESGIAHFLEHLLFQGTETIPPGEFSKIIARNGGQDNAFTSYDYTGYYQRVARDRLDLVMGLEADRMINIVLRDEEVLPERDVVIEERRSRTDNNPGRRLGEQMDAVFYLSHPYGTPIIGWKHEIEELNTEQAAAFYEKFYAPNNAILIVAGDVTVDEVRALAEKHYGPIAYNPDIRQRRRSQEPPHQAARRVTLRDARVTTSQFRRQYLTPSYRTAEPGEGPALEVLGQLFGGGSTSRLYRELIIKRRLAVSAGAWFYGDSLDSGSVGLYGAPAPGTNVEELEAAFDEMIADLLENGVSAEEVEHAKNILIADTIYAIDSQSRLARIFGVALTSGQSVEDVQEWPNRVEAVTAAEVEAVAGKYLRIEASVTGLLLKSEEASQ